MALGKKSKTTTFNSIKDKGKEITDPQEIANALKEHFCSTAKRIQNEAESSNSLKHGDITFESFITKLPKEHDAFKFKEITPTDVKIAISKLKIVGVEPSQFDSSKTLQSVLPIPSPKFLLNL